MNWCGLVDGFSFSNKFVWSKRWANVFEFQSFGKGKSCSGQEKEKQSQEEEFKV